MGMPGREFSAGSAYRYGFNGKENDKDAGESIQDYGMRIYDARLGKFLSVDPITNDYPELTPYQFASNRPIDGIDLDGLEFLHYLLNTAGKAIVTNKDIREGFVKRAKEFVHSIKNSPKAAEKFIDAFGLLGTLGPTHLKQQQQKQDAFRNAVADGMVESAKDLWRLTKSASKGDKKAIGALGFEILLLATPGFEEVGALKFATKELKFLGETLPIAQKTIINSEGRSVTRNFVRNEDDLLKVAEDAAGGSLDNFVKEEGKNRWIGEIDGEKFKIEWEPGGHTSTNEGPHVRIQKWIDGGGKKGKGKWSNGEKYFIQGQETLKKSNK